MVAFLFYDRNISLAVKEKVMQEKKERKREVTFQENEECVFRGWLSIYLIVRATELALKMLRIDFNASV